MPSGEINCIVKAEWFPVCSYFGSQCAVSHVSRVIAHYFTFLFGSESQVSTPAYPPDHMAQFGILQVNWFNWFNWFSFLCEQGASPAY